MGLFGSDTTGYDLAQENVDRNLMLYMQLAAPEYAQMNPELYDYQSANYELQQDDPLMKSMQMSALNKMAGLADSGLSDSDVAQFQKARNMGSQMARGGREAALQDAQARGVGGSGLEFAMREMANQSGAQRSQEAGLAQADSAARQRALYQQAYGNQLSGVRDQNQRTNAANTDIINRFNQTNTQNRNQVGQANVDARNDAWKYNEGLKDANYRNQLDRTNRMAGANDRSAEIGIARNDSERQRQRAMGQMFGSMMGSYFGPAGSSMGGSIGGAIS